LVCFLFDYWVYSHLPLTINGSLQISILKYQYSLCFFVSLLLCLHLSLPPHLFPLLAL
jgi:hypothetical protein